MAPAPPLTDLIATVEADAAVRRPARPPGHRVGHRGRADRSERRPRRPLRRRVPGRRAHLGGDQRVAGRHAAGRPQAVLGDPARAEPLDGAGQVSAGQRASTPPAAWATPSSAPSTCCWASSRRVASGPRSSREHGPHRGVRRASRCVAHTPVRRLGSGRAALHAPRGPGVRWRAQRGPVHGPQLHRHRAPRSWRCSVSRTGWPRRSSPTPAPPTPPAGRGSSRCCRASRSSRAGRPPRARRGWRPST